jgi:hypothetical protein
MKLRIQNLNPIKLETTKVKVGKLSQRAMLRSKGIKSWSESLAN